MKQHQAELTITTSARQIVNITREVAHVVADANIGTGICTLFVRHTSASLLIQENADPSVLRDLSRWMGEVASEKRRWEHDTEGADDMPAHARSALTSTSESIPVQGGRLVLGTWQGIYLWEHRAFPHQRKVVVHVMGA